MANTDTSTSEARPTPAATQTGMAVLAPVIGWLVPGAGHAPHLERPDRFHALVFDFLTEAAA